MSHFLRFHQGAAQRISSSHYNPPSGIERAPATDSISQRQPTGGWFSRIRPGRIMDSLITELIIFSGNFFFFIHCYSLLFDRRRCFFLFFSFFLPPVPLSLAAARKRLRSSATADKAVRCDQRSASCWTPLSRRSYRAALGPRRRLPAASSLPRFLSSSPGFTISLSASRHSSFFHAAVF